jgi:hypothetical protein
MKGGVGAAIKSSNLDSVFSVTSMGRDVESLTWNLMVDNGENCIPE